jgi:type IX secretion system PorP/SprF family membrane protein
MRYFWLVLCFISASLLAQDVHFSQWTKNPVFVSPSFTGSFSDKMRITAQKREQWASVTIPFSTNSFSLDANLAKNGLGGQVIFDQSGSSHLSLTQLNLHYSRSISDWRLGLSFGLAQRRIDYTDLVFIDPLESIVSLSKSYLDFGLGLHRQFRINNYNELQIGYSVFHINSPNRSFLNQEDILTLRHQFFSVLQFDLSNQVNLNPSLLFSNQDKQRELVLGTELSYELNNINHEVILFGSASYRVADAIILAVGTKYNQTFIGLNVDFNVSDFSPATNNYGAWEISFIHTIKHRTISRPNYQACPSFL